MKRNVIMLVLFVVLALAVILVIKSKNRLRRLSESPSATIVTQDGQLTVLQPQPAAVTFEAGLPATNLTGATNKAVKQ